ncbi:5-formyltetrahydrofolate cyclo-ligase [Brevibacillus reuszeri]|uniref:5-formyltetrahydrofolate cyclo-ligase n=1 Tax=Brevibacillus reuszeri TaxID=54915 RepID=UPI00289F83C0|nr:5-formyltetrahydrofolate cyclo-ligase [Brevibacillus reuszeri]
MDKKADKKQLRTHIMEARKAMPPEERKLRSEQACSHLLACERVAGAKAIMAFHPFGAELDILPFVEQARGRGQEIWLPLTLLAERRLVPYVFSGPEMLKQGVYGIWEPDSERAVEADIAKLDVVLVPGVAFDRSGGRMGYGGGFYDRFLAGLKERPYLLGVGFSMQVVDHVPLEPHDIPLDAVVTEEGLFHS